MTFVKRLKKENEKANTLDLYAFQIIAAFDYARALSKLNSHDDIDSLSEMRFDKDNYADQILLKIRSKLTEIALSDEEKAKYSKINVEMKYFADESLLIITSDKLDDIQIFYAMS